MNITKRNKSIVALPKPNTLTLEQAFAMMFKRYEQALKELSQNESIRNLFQLSLECHYRDHVFCTRRHWILCKNI